MTVEKKPSVYRSSAPAVDQAAQLLLCIGKQNDVGTSLTALCKEIGIHKSKGFSILNALMQYDLVTRDEMTKTYSLGPALLPLAQKAKERIDFAAVSRVHLQKLAAETNATVLLGIICHDQFFIAAKYDGNDQLSVTIRLNQSLHITHGAHGKAIFAHLDEKEQSRIFDAGQLLFHGETRDLDEKELHRELAFCREYGYAVDNGRRTPGTSAVSAPVFDHHNAVAAAVVVVGTYGREWFEKFGTKTAHTAGLISSLCGARR
ncbi:MAG: IclR family transcriptional regulator [Desulfotignum sp.]|nr:IclR family transcriptional regulator [Desulfotignum sp.]